jgi:hypothetical protein
MQPVTRAPLAPGFEYYVIVDDDRSAIEALRLKLLFKGKASETVLAVPTQ